MGLHDRRILLSESLIGRGTAEGPGRLVWIIGVSALKHGLAFAAVFVSFTGLWHLRVNGVFALEMMLGAFLLGMLAGGASRVGVLLVGREMRVDPGRYVALHDGGRRRWSFDKLAAVRIIEGPKEWTTVEIDVRRSRSRPTIRFVAKCTEEERKSLNSALGILTPQDREVSHGPTELGSETRVENNRQALTQSAEQIRVLRYRILLGMLIGTYVMTISGVALSALTAIIAGRPGPLLLGAFMLATGGPAVLCLHYLKARLQKTHGRAVLPDGEDERDVGPTQTERESP